jgi:hypothetical protein
MEYKKPEASGRKSRKSEVEEWQERFEEKRIVQGIESNSGGICVVGILGRRTNT